MSGTKWNTSLSVCILKDAVYATCFSYGTYVTYVNDSTWRGGVILLVGGEKGGSGKSCLAQNLAVFLRTVADRDVLLLDSDPQATTLDWSKERDANESLPKIPTVASSGNIRQTLTDLANRYQDIIVDAGGHDSEALRSAMTIATHMLLPFRPKRRDLKTLPKVAQLIRLARAVNPNLVTHAVLTQCPPAPNQAARIEDAKETCRSFEIAPLNAVTMTRNVYDDADESGCSVLEVNTDDKAAVEIRALASELFGASLT